MSNLKETQRIVGIVALAALSTLSCKGFLDGGAAPATGDNGSVTATDQGGAATTPAQLPTTAAPAAVVPVPSSTAPQTTPSPQIETPAALPSPAVLDAVNTAQGRLTGLTTSVQGTKVRFVDCTEGASCTTRLEASSLTGLRDLLQVVSKDQGGIGFVAREQLDAYTGQKFIADVTLGGTATRPVPTDENELLVNNDSP
jgi:hypothetical protein